MRNLVIYVHGKGGSAEEAKHFQPLFAESDVIGFDYKSQNPWEAKSEFSQFFDFHSKEYDSVILIANSIGAFFSMNALAEKKISQALFISPIVNMEKLITDMMMWSNVRECPIEWRIPTCILYGEKDNLTSGETISEFSNRINADLTVMDDGEHWFHTDEQMKFLDDWIINSIR